MPNIIVIGAAILDVLVTPAEARVFETGSYPAQDIRMVPGGDGMNEALVLARLGADVMLETVTGDDMAGNVVRTYCRENGVALVNGSGKPELTTGINVVLVQKNGERNFLTNSNGSLRKLGVEDIHLPFPNEAKILCFASIFVSPKLGNEELVRIFSAAKAQQMTVCADMTKRKQGETLKDIKEALSYVDYLFPNKKEAALVTGETDPARAAEAFYRAGVKHVVIKCGADGCYIKAEDEAGFVPAVENVQCIDTTGAGDSFAAGFVFALSAGKTFRECAEFANQCGAKAVAQIGAATWSEKILSDKERQE